MCTLTAGFTGIDEPIFRMVFNRDELRSRSEGVAPQVFHSGSRRCIYPIDPDRGGTWIGINDSSLIFAILNLNEKPVVEKDGTPLPLPFTLPDAPLSRGSIIPGLISSTSIEEVKERISRLDMSRFPPFRLVTIDGKNILEIRWNTIKMEKSFSDEFGKPVFYTSSGLGDSFAYDRRFSEWKTLEQKFITFINTQNEFHRSFSPEAPEVSVVMSRPDAITVSRTTIDMFSDKAIFSYEDLRNESVEPKILQLPLQKNLYIK